MGDYYFLKIIIYTKLLQKERGDMSSFSLYIAYSKKDYQVLKNCFSIVQSYDSDFEENQLPTQPLLCGIISNIN